MKLAIISPGFVPVPAVKGGAIEQLIEYIIIGNEKEHKFDIDLYTLNDKNLYQIDYKYTNLIKIDETKANLFLRTCYMLKNKFNRLLHTDKTYSVIRDRFVKKYKENYYDAVLVENNMDLYEQLYSKFKSERIYFHLHNDIDCGDIAKSKRKAKFVLNTADQVFVVSKFLKNKLLKIEPERSNIIRIVYNGVVSDNLKQISLKKQRILKNKLHISNDKIIFTFVGRLISDKGIDKLIEALQLLKDNKRIECIIVGNNFFGTIKEDKYTRKLKKIAKGLENRIHFTGYVDNKKINEIYSISDCVVIPAQYEEVFGVVALEAMTMGIPVIASNSGGLPEVLSPKCAIFINRDDNFVKNMSKAMLNLASNKNLRRRMGYEGQIRSKRFANTEKKYFELISNYIDD